MNKIYRLRPSSEETIDELKNNYLWFSQPSGYKDIEDANIVAFIDNNESIKDSFERVFTNSQEIGQAAGHIGICCFTESLPPENKWKNFPKGYNGIFVEYDKRLIEEFFINKYGIGDCFKNVEYLDNPIVFNSYSNYDVLWETTNDGQLYKTLREIEKDSKLMDQLFLKMFTRIGHKFYKQQEKRIILGGRNIPDNSSNVKGYKIDIPRETIKNIYIHPKTPIDTRKKLDELNISYIEIKKPNC